MIDFILKTFTSYLYHNDLWHNHDHCVKNSNNYFMYLVGLTTRK